MAGGYLDDLSLPHQDLRPAGQPDIKSTILEVVQDPAARVCIGRNLLTKPSPGDFALAVRPGGIRYENAAGSYLMDRRFATRWHLLRETAPGSSYPPIEDLPARLQTWSKLIEANRVWNPDLAGQ